MNKLFLSVLSSGPLSVLILLATVIAGAVLASRWKTVDFKLRRVAYFWITQVLWLAFALSLLATFLILQAVPTWLFVPACVLILLTFLSFGAGLYVTSAARSNHMSDEPTFAWLVFIPLANLWLFFKSGEKDPFWRWYENGIKDGFIVAAAFIPGVLASEILSGLSEVPLSRTAIYAFEENAPSIEDKAFFMSLAMKKNAWSACPSRMAIQDVDAEGAALRVECDVRASGFTRAVPTVDTAKQIDRVCASKRYRAFLADGGRFAVTYPSSEGTAPLSLTIHDADCVG